MFDRIVVVRGGGDLGSGVALRLWRVGFRVVVLESPRPVAVRRSVSFAEAVYEGCASVEEAEGRLASSTDEVHAVLGRRQVPVVVDPEAAILGPLTPWAVVDAIMAKRNTGTSRDMAPVVIALGPGFDAGSDAHAVVETNRGPNLGRVIWTGPAEPDTGDPAAVSGHSVGRVLRAPAAGPLHAVRSIGEIVEEGAVLATVNGTPVRAGFRGLLRGMARDGLVVEQGMKIGDLDPRLDPILCRSVSDKALAVAGGVLEAILVLTVEKSV
jgi:xanthine dehydrogenase accessory factor